MRPMIRPEELTAEQRIQKAKIRILNHNDFRALAGILTMGNVCVVEPDHKIQTACTDGRDEWYNRSFVDDLSDAQLRGVVLHECFHKLYKHLTTWHCLWTIDKQLANQACDYVINLKIFCKSYIDDGIVSNIEGMLYDEQFKGMNAQQVFNKLKDDSDTQNKDGGQQQQGGDPGDGGGGQGFDEHDWEGAQEMTEAEVKEVHKQVDTAIRQGAMMAGKTGTGGDRGMFNDCLEVRVDWREVFRRFISDTCSGDDYSTYARPNRRGLQYDLYLPSGVSEQVGELVLAIDMSCSIQQREINVFLSAVRDICNTVRPSKVRVLYWDTTVCADEKYEMHEVSDLTKSTKPQGGGGTDVNCVTEYMASNNIKPQAALILTDGDLYNGWGTWSCPVLWAIIDNKSAIPECGTAVHINSGDIL